MLNVCNINRKSTNGLCNLAQRFGRKEESKDTMSKKWAFCTVNTKYIFESKECIVVFQSYILVPKRALQGYKLVQMYTYLYLLKRIVHPKMRFLS